MRTRIFFFLTLNFSWLTYATEPLPFPDCETRARAAAARITQIYGPLADNIYTPPLSELRSEDSLQGEKTYVFRLELPKGATAPLGFFINGRIFLPRTIQKGESPDERNFIGDDFHIVETKKAVALAVTVYEFRVVLYSRLQLNENLFELANEHGDLRYIGQFRIEASEGDPRERSHYFQFGDLPEGISSVHGVLVNDGTIERYFYFGFQVADFASLISAAFLGTNGSILAGYESGFGELRGGARGAPTCLTGYAYHGEFGGRDFVLKEVVVH